ncbi:hypothetical protein Aperf_G00000074856 [Anoplocephala perfoliata]
MSICSVLCQLENDDTSLSPERIAAINFFNIIADVVEEVDPSIVYVRDPSDSTSESVTGFIVNDRGLVVTAERIANRRSYVMVRLSDGREFIANVCGVDSKTGLALILIDADKETLKQLPVAKLAAVDTEVKPGDLVFTIGCNVGITGAVTIGIISAVNREFDDKVGIKYYQTDATLTDGCAGAPLINLKGEIIGVNTMRATASFGFSIPISHVYNMIALYKQKQSEDLKVCRDPSLRGEPPQSSS